MPAPLSGWRISSATRTTRCSGRRRSTPLSTPVVATLLKMVGGLGLALAMNQHFQMKNLVRALLLLPFIVPTVLSTVAWMWMLDPAFSVVNRVLIALGWPKPGPSWLGDPDAGDGLDHRHQHLARPAVLRDYAARRPADRASRALRGRDHRRRRRLAALPLRYPAAVAADHPDRHPVLGHLHLRRLPARLCA